ncbi:MAG: UvrD-helicase domain-containing protein [Bacilli bacterium]
MLDGLNKEQIEAVKKTEGPLLVLAGAGSGKTKVLTTRIAYLIEEKNVNPKNILAITFTNKAACEMKSRLYNLVGSLTNNIQVSTFHSFGVKILKENAKYLGYDSNFVIMDSDDSLTLVKKICKDLNVDISKFSPKAIRYKISSCKNELINYLNYEKYAGDEFEKLVVKIYKKYDEILFKNNAVDFDDLLILPIKLFLENKEVLDYYQERFKYILIDEYQDTNHAQFTFTKLIASKYQNICVVGDNDQAIFGFRGANFKNILNFEKYFKNTKTILLEQNYRSTNNILKASNKLIENNKQRKDKNLWSDKGEGELITYTRSYDEKEEARNVILEVNNLIDKHVALENIAVLYRTNAQSRIVEEEFLKSNIPYKVVGSFYFYGRREIKDLISYLRLIHNTKDNISLTRVINSPKRGIGIRTIGNLIEKSDHENISMYDAINSGKELEFKKIIEKLIEISKDASLTTLIDNVLELSGLKQELVNEKTLDADIRLENLEEFKSISKEFEARDGSISLEDFLMEISLVSDITDYKQDNNRVSLMTVHSVKGLEFDYVFVIGLEEGIFPHINSLRDGGELEEERRLMYVAMTRAKIKLYLLNTRQRLIFGKTQNYLPSRFIKEIPEDYIDIIKKDINKELVSKEDMFTNDNSDLKVDDNVYHDIFGKGKIIEASDTLFTVMFNNTVGVRKLLKNHKMLRRI